MSQHDRGCLCGGAHLTREHPIREGDSSRVSGAQVELKEVEDEWDSQVQVKALAVKVCLIKAKETSPKHEELREAKSVILGIGFLPVFTIFLIITRVSPNRDG